MSWVLTTGQIAMFGMGTTLLAGAIGPVLVSRTAKRSARRDWSLRAADAYAAGRQAWSYCAEPLKQVELFVSQGFAPQTQFEERTQKVTEAAVLLRAVAAAAPNNHTAEICEQIARRLATLATGMIHACNLGMAHKAGHDITPALGTLDDLQKMVTEAVEGGKGKASLERLFDELRVHASRMHHGKRVPRRARKHLASQSPRDSLQTGH